MGNREIMSSMQARRATAWWGSLAIEAIAPWFDGSSMPHPAPSSPSLFAREEWRRRRLLRAEEEDIPKDEKVVVEVLQLFGNSSDADWVSEVVSNQITFKSASKGRDRLITLSHSHLIVC